MGRKITPGSLCCLTKKMLLSHACLNLWASAFLLLSTSSVASMDTGIRQTLVQTSLCLLLTVGTWWFTWPLEPHFLHLVLEIPRWHELGMKWDKLFHVLFLTVSGKFSADDSHLQCYPVYFLPCIIFKLFFSSHGSGSRRARYGKWDFLHIKKAWLVSWKYLCLFLLAVHVYCFYKNELVSKIIALKRDKATPGVLPAEAWTLAASWHCSGPLLPSIGSTGLDIYSGRITEPDCWLDV